MKNIENLIFKHFISLPNSIILFFFARFIFNKSFSLKEKYLIMKLIIAEIIVEYIICGA